MCIIPGCIVSSLGCWKYALETYLQPVIVQYHGLDWNTETQNLEKQ